MAKKQGRRAPVKSDRRSSSSVPSNREDPSIRLLNPNKRLTLLNTLLILIVTPAISAYIYRMLYAGNTDLDPSLPFVYQRGLVKTDINYQEILTVCTQLA